MHYGEKGRIEEFIIVAHDDAIDDTKSRTYNSLGYKKRACNNGIRLRLRALKCIQRATWGNSLPQPKESPRPIDAMALIE